ncbi:MAG: 4-alpha-glucanotransferase, partial [Actinobacteria bacterium]|nr:4-alpha-glucanotransferase [Actinomycetota bacterium]
MGADGPQPPGMGDDNPVWVVRTGDRVRAEGPWTLTLEDGGELTGEEVLPADVPLGYHHLVLHGGDRSVRLSVSPGRCHLPAGLHEWGFALQLYALRSGDSWGLGDLADLHTFASRARQLGAGFLLINPLHAALPGLPQQASPYFPSSRCFHNPL